MPTNHSRSIHWEAGFKVVEWDGRTPHVLLDKEEWIISILSGQPKDDRWHDTVAAACTAMKDARDHCIFTDDDMKHQRGVYPCLAIGVSFGGGQQEILCTPRETKTYCDPMVGSGAVSRGKKRARAGTPSPCGKGKQRQASPSLMGHMSSGQGTMLGEDKKEYLYDDQAWVQATNDIVNKLSRTNVFLGRSILMLEWSVWVVEGSRVAMERGVSAMEKFMEGQAHLQVLLLRCFGSVGEGSESRRADYGAESAEEEAASDVEIQEVQGPAVPMGGNEGVEIEVVVEAGVEEVAEAAEDTEIVM
ncbi:uncharacterized protein EDB91DRAFT_1241282 [Suillus paluster]|uniref:uncharacterized protein n=1 Tax=Suillus paluster TaxID=48578 RepID=UPI001B86EC21|nr:uncharacterized protein EDB91DRAFT_1241282 [Suillus paluster]KAG1756185.1 hypothetical protein EDB91DRAFT_1241282 [Suillus paluster]